MKKIIKEKDGYGTVQRDFMQMDISVYAKCVYTLLRTYSGQNNSCYPSMKTICDDLKISKPTLIKAINELEKIDMVAVKRSKKNESKENSVNTYIPLSIMIEIDVENYDYQSELDGLGGKGDLPRGKGDLPGVVKEVYRKNNNIKNNIEEGIYSKSSKKIKTGFIKPTLTDVIEFFKSKGLNEIIAKRAFDHYDMADWKDSNGKPVVSWKQKMNTNWISNNVDNPKYKFEETDLFSSGGNNAKSFGDAQDSRMII